MGKPARQHDLRGLSRPVPRWKAHGRLGRVTSWAGYLVYIEDLSLPKTAANWLTVDGACYRSRRRKPSDDRVVQSGRKRSSSLTHLGATRWGATICPSTTGHRRAEEYAGCGVPGELSRLVADGQTIAVTHMYGNSGTIVQFQEGGISVVRQSATSATGWTRRGGRGAAHDQQERYTPNFVPDSSSYCTASRPADGRLGIRWSTLRRSFGDGLGSPAQANATPVLLAKANTPGVADKLTLADGRSSL